MPLNKWQFVKYFGDRVILLPNSVIVRKDHTKTVANFIDYMIHFSNDANLNTVIIKHLLNITGFVAVNDLKALDDHNLATFLIAHKRALNDSISLLDSDCRYFGFNDTDEVFCYLLEGCDAKFYSIERDLPKTLPARLKYIIEVNSK